MRTDSSIFYQHLSKSWQVLADRGMVDVLAQERRQRVLDLVSQRGFVALSALAKSIKASESTIRRDLDYWHERGLLQRTHGGAMFVGDGTTLPALEERSSQQIEEKRQIARAAAERIRDGDSVLLDGGTTTLEIARLLVGRRLQVVTNSLPIANLFASSRETDLVVLGGYVSPKTGVALGPLTIKMMAEVHVQQTLVGVSGITAKGFFNSNGLLVETERQMMQCADQVVVVADHTKIGRQALAFLCELSAVHALITDGGVSAEQRAVLGDELELIVAGASADRKGARA